MTPEIHKLAARVMSDGRFRWVEDGSTIKQIVDKLDALMAWPKTTAGKAARREYLVSNLKALDRSHGWKMDGKTQEQEDALYGMFVDLLLK